MIGKGVMVQQEHQLAVLGVWKFAELEAALSGNIRCGDEFRVNDEETNAAAIASFLEDSKIGKPLISSSICNDPSIYFVKDGKLYEAYAIVKYDMDNPVEIDGSF